MVKLNLSESGFITDYLISGPKITDFEDDKVDNDQLRYEKYLRSIIANNYHTIPNSETRLGNESEIGMEWKYYYSPGNWFVDVSSFYPTLKRIELLATTNIYVEEDLNVPAYLWTYGAIDIWLNSEHVCCIDKPVYKPIMQKRMELNLHKGVNQLYIKLQNLGVRDTRNIFGIQLLDNLDRISITLPDEKNTKPFIDLANWLSNIKLEGNILKFDETAPCEVSLIYKNNEQENVTAKKFVELRSDESVITIEGIINGQKLNRTIEIIEEVRPKYNAENISTKENLEYIYKRFLVDVQLDNSILKGLSIFHLLARAYSYSRLGKAEQASFYENLNRIEARRDCSDFIMSGLLRYMKNYPLDDKLEKRAKEVILNYRYWMDQKGSDGMCFWSENHALAFYSCQMIAGEMYPDDYFTRGEKVGKAMFEEGKAKVDQWLKDIENDGYEEFLSGPYMCVTFGALLNVVDFGEKELSERAGRLLDRLLEELSLHTFKGSVIAPQGRVYRDVIYPFSQGVQAIINMINKDAPYSINEWLVFMETSKYQVPFEFIKLMNSPTCKEYSTGNALIRINKTKDYIMTSVQSPREDENPHMWDNISLNEGSDTSSYVYVKSLNERFHGTTRFEPGVYGYQQHMWSAALDNDIIVFANHPGASTDESSMRPGYWYGNGIMPAVKQQGNMIGSIYVIPDNYPIHFTHLHWKEKLFDNVIRNDNWLFGEKNGAYIGIWCSDELHPVDQRLFNSEYRAYADKTAYICCCSCIEECGDFEAFIKKCKETNPCFDKDSLTLSAGIDYSLVYKKYENLTQYI